MNKQSEQMKYIINTLTEEQAVGMNYFKTKLDNGHLELSPSATKKLIDEPLTYFDQYVCGDFDDKESKAQKKGTLIHTLLLEPEEFENKYCLMGDGIKAPEGGALDLINFIANNLEGNQSNYLGDHEKMILEYMVDANYHQKLVDDKKNKELTGDKKRLEKVLTVSNIAYFEYLLSSKGKEIISEEFYKQCEKKAELLKRIKDKERITIINDGAEDISCELELKVKNFEGFNLKCIIDMLKIDITNKKALITDVKSIGGTLATTLKWDIEKYRYGVQAAINYLAVKELLSSKAFKEIVPGSEKFAIEFGFLFVDGNNTTKYVHVSKPTMERYINELKMLLNVNVKYHLDNFDFSAPYIYLTEDVTL